MGFAQNSTSTKTSGSNKELTVIFTVSSPRVLFNKVSVPVELTDKAFGFDDTKVKYSSNEIHDDGAFDPSDFTSTNAVPSEKLIVNNISVSSPISDSIHSPSGSVTSTDTISTASLCTVKSKLSEKLNHTASMVANPVDTPVMTPDDNAPSLTTQGPLPSSHAPSGTPARTPVSLNAIALSESNATSNTSPIVSVASIVNTAR